MRQIVAVIILLFILFPIFNFSQRHILKPNGELLRSKDEFKTEKKYSVKTENGINEEIATQNEKLLYLLSTPDTLGYSRDYNFNTNFGFHGQDAMMQFFVAPADMWIKGIGFSCSDDSGAVNGADVSVRLIKLNWSYEKLDSINSVLYLGYYPSADSFNNADYFGEDAGGNWQDSTNGVYPIPPWTDNIDPILNTFNYDLWSDSGKGINVTPIEQDEAGNYQWVNTDILGFEPTIMQGEVFAVVIKHTGQNLSDDRIGFWASNEPGILGWKYYASDRFSPNDGLGWWVRQYTWDFAVAVELAGVPRLYIEIVTQAGSTFSTAPQIVEAIVRNYNPSGSQEGIESVELLYSIDDRISFTSIEMEYKSADVYSGEIPSQPPGTTIIYKIRATDFEGYMHESIVFSYSILETITREMLIIFNGGNGERAVQLAPYYLQDIGLNYDLWASYGPIEKELVEQYLAVIEIHSEHGPEYDNRDALRSFAEEGNNLKKLGVIGQEALGYLLNYKDSTFKPGDYEYDILGVQISYNDVNYDTANGIGNNSPSLVNAIENTDLGDPLFTWVSENSVDSLFFDPTGILGSDNWMDQFDPRDDINSEVFMTGYSFNGIEKPIGHNFFLSSGTEVLFMTFDPLVLNTADSIWVGYSHQNPLYQFLNRIIIPSVKKLDYEIPKNFSLSQNYPNPFNPTTTINYSIPQLTIIANKVKQSQEITSVNYLPRNDNIQVKLTVYDILGREVTTLVNQTQKPGNYKVEFNASKLTSGVYFYQLNASEFLQSKKMLLIK